MANEQIVITRNDEGIELEVQFIDSKKKPVDLTGCTVEVGIRNPLLSVTQVQAYIINATNGTAGIILDKSMTNTLGLWSTYWSAINETGFVTAQEAIYYFILPRYGGADND